MHLSQKILADRIHGLLVGLGLIGTTILSAVFAILLAIEVTRPALVIERECDSRIAQISSRDQTENEIESFLNQALKVRFETHSSQDPYLYLSQEQVLRRQKEQAELKTKNIDQRLIIRNIKKEKDEYIVEADRLLAVESARSALPVHLSIQIQSRNRSLSNPYGLVLTKADLVQNPEKK